MRIARNLKIVLLSLLFPVFAAGCAGTHATATVASALDSEGLQPIEIETIEYVAVHPGADLASFIEVYIEPVSLEFRKGWRPMATGSQMTASASQLEALEEEIKALFTETFTAALLANPRLKLVDAPAVEVLRISPRLTDISVAQLAGQLQPGTATGRRSGTLALELAINDVRTGTLIVRMNDKRVVADASGRTLSWGATRNEFNTIFEFWGRFIGSAILNITVD